MRSRKSLLALLLTCCAAFAQSNKQDSSPVHPPVQRIRPLARLSFRSTYGVDSRYQQGSPSICFMLERDGNYRMARRTSMQGDAEVSGVLSPDDLSQFNEMLSSAEAIKPTAGGWVQGGSETFIAEIHRDDQAVHVRWIDPDHTRPFPESIKRIVYWLQDFKPSKMSSSLQNLPDLSICPTWSESLKPPAPN